MPNRIGEERSVTGLFTELTREMTSLIRHEIALARAEIGEKVSYAQSGVVFLAAGAMFAFSGFLVLLACAVIALSYVWPAWLAALTVGLVVTFLGLALLASGKSHLKAKNLKPTRTTESLRHDRQFVKEHVR